MSRIGNNPITIPEKVDVNYDNKGKITVKGPLGTLERTLNFDSIKMKIKDNSISFERENESREAKSTHGLFRTLVSNMIEGVTKGYKKTLMLKGVGYKVQVSGKNLKLNIGFSHPIDVEIPEGIKVEVPKANVIDISGSDKEQVGSFSARIRQLRPVEPYHAYGIKYSDEHVRRKEVKQTGK